MKKIVKYLSMPIACFAVCGIAAVGSNQNAGEAKTKLSAAVLNADVASMTFEDALASIKENSSKVKIANVGKTVVNESGETSTLISYEKGEKYMHYSETTGVDTEYEYKEEKWFSEMSDGSIYALWGNTDTEPTYNENEFTADVFNGYQFSLGYAVEAYGLENFIAGMYEYMSNDENMNTNGEVFAVNSEGSFVMTFDYVSTLYYRVFIGFGIDENGMLVGGEMQVQTWWNNQTQDDEGNWLTTEVEVEGEDGTTTTETVPAGEDWSGTYVASHAWDTENEYWYLVGETDPDETTVYAFEQLAEGEVVNNMMDYRMTSMKVTDAEGNALPATLEMETGATAWFNVTDVAPATASTKANKISVVLPEDAVNTYAMIGDFYTKATDYNTSETYTDAIKIIAYKPGTYNVSICLNDVEVASTVITVKNPLPKTLGAAVYTEEWGNYYQAAMGETYSMFAGTSVVIGGMTDNTKADASTEIEVLDANGDEVDCWTPTTVNYGGNEFNAIVFAPTAVGTYTINLYSTIVEELEASVTVTVNEAPSLADILSGEYDVFDDMSGEKCGSVVFADGKATVTVSIQTGMDFETWEPIFSDYVVVYAVDVDGDNLFTLEDGNAAIALKITDEFELVVTYDQNYGTPYAGNYLTEFATEKVESEEPEVPGEEDSSEENSSEEVSSEEVSSEEVSSEEVSSEEVSSEEVSSEEVSSEDEVVSSEDEVVSSEDEVVSSEDEVVSSEDEVVSSEDEVVSSAPASSSSEEESSSKKGCGSVVGGIACGIAALGLCAVAVFKKKEN